MMALFTCRMASWDSLRCVGLEKGLWRSSSLRAESSEHCQSSPGGAPPSPSSPPAVVGGWRLPAPPLPPPLLLLHASTTPNEHSLMPESLRSETMVGEERASNRDGEGEWALGEEE